MKQEIDEELRFHVEQRTAENIANGMPRDEATREARRRFGNVQSVREECRETRGASFGETTLQDIRFGLRMLWKNPGFATVAVLTLALGIGACTAIFSLVNGVLLRALPYDQPGQLVQLWEDPSGKGQDRNSVAGAQFADWKEQVTSMEGISVVRRVNLNLTGEGRPERLSVHKVSADYLQILRLQPFLGRGFLPDEDQPGKDRVVVLTHRLWREHFGGATNLVGQAVRLDSQSYTVIGILPAKPQLPIECDALTPFVFGSESWHRSRSDHRLRVIGRLKSGVTLEQARAEMAAITQRLKPSYPSWKKDWGVAVVPMHEQLTGAIRPQLWVLFGAVGFVLLIACANVAGLLLARMAARQKEMAIRAALGAGRWRVIRQLLTESVLLSMLGGGLGLVLAFWGVNLFTKLSADNLPRVAEVGVDASALGFALLMSLGTGVAFGLAPALHLARPDLTGALKQEGRASRSGSGRLRGALIIAEVALALMLLAGAGLMLKTLFRLQAVPSGFNPHGVLAMDMSLDDTKYPAGDRRAAFVRQIIQRIESLPGVEAAGTATTLPMSGATDSSVRAESRPDLEEFYIGSDYDLVSGDYFPAMGIPLLKGRRFTERDDSRSAPRVAILNEALAKKIFPNEDPLGQRVRFWGESWEVAGVVGNVRQRGLDRESKEHIYLPQAFSPFPCSLVVRTKVPPMALADVCRKEILMMDSDQPISNIRTLEQIVAGSASQRRLMLVLLGLFAGAAMLLAAIGLYGTMAYAVSQRTREIGIRMALGAQRGEVLLQVMRQGLKLTFLGVALGLVGAFALTRVLAHLLFEVTPQDPFTFVGVAVLLVAVALIACWLPARRAMKINPMEALRSE
ncbi:MAG: ABC transporter permease [Verrucomicrobia bacterium]|nr:ABC transporter permease [Verrucomicrobiota bacterium]